MYAVIMLLPPPVTPMLEGIPRPCWARSRNRASPVCRLQSYGMATAMVLMLIAVKAAGAADTNTTANITQHSSPWGNAVCFTKKNNSRSNWGMRLVLTPPVQTAFVGNGAVRDCFKISKDLPCDASRSCCRPEQGPSRVAIKIDDSRCTSFSRFSWTVDGQRLRFKVVAGHLVSNQLGEWKARLNEKQLCVVIAPDPSGRCSTLGQLCRGKHCIYRLYTPTDEGSTGRSCCVQGNTRDVAYLGGNSQPMPVRKVQRSNNREDEFSIIAQAGQQLSTAIKVGDARAAANALMAARPAVTTAAASSSAENTTAAYTPQAVIRQAELPAVFDATGFNTPGKSQGRSTMAASYAAVAAMEAAVAAAFAGGNPKGINISEKALHWCDAANPAVPSDSNITNITTLQPTVEGWHAQTAMETLALYGAVNASCYGDKVGVQYPISELGFMNGTCAGQLASCGRLKGFQFVDLTPNATAADFTKVLEHIMKQHAVVARIQVYGGMLDQLTDYQAGGVVQTNTGLRNAVVISEPNATQTKFNHVVAVVGWNFSSSNISEQYWLIKDSLPSVGVKQIWKLGVASAVGMGSWIGGFVNANDSKKAAITPLPLKDDETASPASKSDLAATTTPGPDASSSSSDAPVAATSADTTASSSSSDGIMPPIVDPARANISQRTDINPDDMVTNQPFGANVQNFMSTQDTNLWSFLGGGSSNGLTPTRMPCQNYTTEAECERLSVIWERWQLAMQLKGQQVRAIEAFLADNWQVLVGKDMACLPAGLALSLCTN